jgi:hypothetical protein
MTLWSRILGAAALLILASTSASAQTIYVRNAKPGEKVEVVLNGATVASAPADQAGEAKLPIDLAKTGKPEIDANIFIDACDAARRVIIVERGGAVPPVEPGGNCTRRDTQGVFWLRGINTLVVDLSPEANPSLLLVKGSYTPRDVAEAEGTVPKRYAPTGLSLFGSAAWTSLSNVVANACGNVGDCNGSGSGLGFAVGGTYWINRYIGVEGAYVRPKQVKITGSGTGFSFTNSLKSDIVTVMGKVGASPGIVRFYGQAGIDYHQATSDTSQTVPDRTITVDGVDEVIPGGTQTFQLKTEGWGMVFGGGLEVWVNHNLGLFGEANYAKIKGDRVGGGAEGSIDDWLTYITVGARFRLGGGGASAK